MWEDETARERTGHPPSYAEAKNEGNIRGYKGLEKMIENTGKIFSLLAVNSMQSNIKKNDFYRIVNFAAVDILTVSIQSLD